MPQATGKRPVILMTGSFDVEPSRGLERVYYYRNYPAAVESAGAVALNVSRCGAGTAEQLAALADGLYLTGGGDVDPRYYGETALGSCGEPDPRRDELELALGRAFLKAEKPILGVCRGLQVLNVLLGGGLWQDIPSQLGMEHPDGRVHWVEAEEGSPFFSLFGGRFQVNSYHHQAVKDLAPGLLPGAWDETGKLVEAFSHKTLPVWAVQWYPERMTGPERYTREGPDMAPLFRLFVERCREGR